MRDYKLRLEKRKEFEKKIDPDIGYVELIVGLGNSVDILNNPLI